MTRTILEVHVLQTVPPSCLNRDDTGTPKTAVYGGVPRARVSSQAWKRVTRRDFQQILDPSQLGVRTRRVAELLAGRIRTLNTTISEQAAWALAAETIQTATGSKVDIPKRAANKTTDGGPEPAPESKYLLFLSALQLDGLAELAVKAGDDPKAFFKDKGIKDEAKKIANTRHSVDIALFGRMVADSADINVDGAAQVAHAISVHRVDNESDYYTAVDDYQRDDSEETGAGMIGTIEFNSATLYRYACVDVDLLRRNLGNGLHEGDTTDEPVRQAVEAFLQCFITSLPTGRINTFAHHTLPDAVLVKIRSTRPISYVAAFEEPCHAEPETGGHLRQACQALADYIPQVEEAYGDDQPTPSWLLRVGKNTSSLTGLGEELPLHDLVHAAGQEIAHRQGPS
ncbi:type I-E CRISPR-associated protein Cas7/Cse4/CasC [Nonomuraea endophytica]|uniref:CRISPR system Cascade subunit CasC n=1 Tax=Nonomuraea endophytica TaxID=714136 RepID=A0A7W8AG04_9ACTN|nr:type I-E CRISPR-associated protein Cas7/Cse4/CasC [Nonomuraea endophytica]MBB5085069.1 CRISPR system Cascade subunit CasC [Nonomuraea endophytica]